MDVAGYCEQVVVGVDQKSLVSALVQVPGAVVFSVECRSVADIEMAHEFGEISLRGED